MRTYSVVLERPRVSIEVRRNNWFRRIVPMTIGVTLIGAAASLVGV
ncbi:hypothetical protein AB4Z18_08235 [Leifsonia sp. 2TAF2]